ncbi:hypothetical protein L7F22_063793 [Adiantum nelumboides]|nr:hypothetical protein [Adiantum nelumboides]
MTPFQAYYGCKPTVLHFRVFGCSVFVHIPKEKRQKLDFKSRKLLFLGYSAESDAYRLYDPDTRTTTVSRDVVFDESFITSAEGAAAQPIPILPPPSLPDPPASPVITPSTSHPVPPIQPPDVSPDHALSDSDSDLDVADVTPEVDLAPPRREKRIPGWLYSTGQQTHEVGESSRPPQTEDEIFRTQLVTAVAMFTQVMQNPRFMAFLQPLPPSQSIENKKQKSEPAKAQPQVNADECKLSVETLKSLNKDRDSEEEQIFRELYMELEEIDRRVSRTRSRKKVVVRGSATRGRGSSTSAVCGGGRASTRAPTTYVRRGSGSGSSTTATTLENVPLSRSTEPREPEFDDDGNILSEGDYGLFSTHFDTSSDEDDTHDDSDWETDTST